MLTTEEYELLDESLRAQLLMLDGTFLMMRKTPNVNVELYALYNFYVELFFDKKNDDPLYLKSFEFGDRLNIYLEGIVVDNIFETR